MKRISFFLASFPFVLTAQPQCAIDNNFSERLLGVLSGTATGFTSGRIYVTVTNGTRKYTTITDKDGNWALTYADLDAHSDVLCWQENKEETARTSSAHK